MYNVIKVTEQIFNNILNKKDKKVFILDNIEIICSSYFDYNIYIYNNNLYLNPPFNKENQINIDDYILFYGDKIIDIIDGKDD